MLLVAVPHHNAADPNWRTTSRFVRHCFSSRNNVMLLTRCCHLLNLLCVTKWFAGGGIMDAQQAARNLEVIRTLMERTCQYQLLTARAGLVAGTLAGLGALSFLFLSSANPWHFGTVWALVFAGSVLATALGTVMRGRERGEQVWSR